MHQVRVFVNPKASHSTHHHWKEQLERRLFRSQVDFVTPRSAPELETELDRAIQEKVDVVVSVGGDGTVNTLVQKLGGSDTSYLVIPGGTANDFARELGVVGNLEQAIQMIREGRFRHMDLIKVNGKCMATNGGIGFASSVASQVNHLRQKIPAFQYLMKGLGGKTYEVVLGALLLGKRLEYFDIRMDVQDQSYQVRTPLLLVNNQPEIAGSFKIAPRTKQSDGRFNVCVFLHQTLRELIKSIWAIRKGMDPAQDRQVLSLEVESLKLENLNGENLSFFGDGELFSKSSQFQIEIIPNALKVYAPLSKGKVEWAY